MPIPGVTFSRTHPSSSTRLVMNVCWHIRVLHIGTCPWKGFYLWVFQNVTLGIGEHSVSTGTAQQLLQLFRKNCSTYCKQIQTIVEREESNQHRREIHPISELVGEGVIRYTLPRSCVTLKQLLKVIQVILSAIRLISNTGNRMKKLLRRSVTVLGSAFFIDWCSYRWQNC